MGSKKILAVLMVMLSAIISGCGYDDNVMRVREGHLNIAPTVPVGKAFDKFFANGEWKSFKSTEGETVVEFTGDCSWYNAPAKMTVQFTIKGDEFEIHYVGINGVGLTLIEGIAVVSKVLEEYKS